MSPTEANGAPGTSPLHAPSPDTDHRQALPPYRGRFAPTPSGPLHDGSVVAALASWLDARAHRGQWLVRIEDTDTPRCVPGADRVILQQLEALGLRPDEPVTWQSRREAHYAAALARLQAIGAVYACGCSRQDITRALQARGVPRERHAAAVYPGTCRDGLKGRTARAWRVALPPELTLSWLDRRLGPQQQHLPLEVGDFVIRRADGLWAYQLAVVVDDALQGITHVVRGEDLADNTPRQIHLQRLLGWSTPTYLHTPLVHASDGQKLSKQTGAPAADTARPIETLNRAAAVLGLPPIAASNLDDWQRQATDAWARQTGVPSALSFQESP